MNWKDEKEKLEQRASWFDPQINSSHEIEILEEVDLSHYFEMEYKGPSEKEAPPTHQDRRQGAELGHRPG